MKILYIAPLPPPITGHSLAAKVLFDELSQSHDVSVVDLSKDSFKGGVDSFKRVREVVDILFRTRKQKKGVDLIYLTISESYAGNLKDLFIYLICYRKLPKFWVHLHGGSIQKLLFEKSSIIYGINRFFLKKLAGIIVLGESHVGIFSPFIPKEKIHIVPNFALDFLFSTGKEVEEKFNDLEPLRILFLSNMQLEKGYDEMADAYLALDSELKKKIRIDFAGRFDVESEKETFLNKIKDAGQMYYHGIVHGDEKKDLLAKAHVFCIATSFLEGQPIAILEAYAGGCVVLATGQSGILDIFQDKTNGFLVKEKSAVEVKRLFEKVVAEKDSLVAIAKHNNEMAQKKYRTSIYNSSLKKIMGL